MRRSALMLAGLVILLTLGVTAQESRSEISLQGTGFFTKDTNGQGISRTTTDTGGFLVGYRYHLNRWLSAEANYGWGRDTQKYFSTGGVFRNLSQRIQNTRHSGKNLSFWFMMVKTYSLCCCGRLMILSTGDVGVV